MHSCELNKNWELFVIKRAFSLFFGFWSVSGSNSNKNYGFFAKNTLDTGISCC